MIRSLIERNIIFSFYINFISHLVYISSFSYQLLIIAILLSCLKIIFFEIRIDRWRKKKRTCLFLKITRTKYVRKKQLREKKKSWVETLYSYKHAGASCPKGSATLMNMKGVSVRSCQGIMHRLTCIQSYTTKVSFSFFFLFFLPLQSVYTFTSSWTYDMLRLTGRRSQGRLEKKKRKMQHNLCIELRARSIPWLIYFSFIIIMVKH